MASRDRFRFRVSVAVGAALFFAASNVQSQQEPDTSFEEVHETAAKLILPNLLAEVQRDPMALDLLMRLPVPIRSAVPNVAWSMRRQAGVNDDACDAVLIYLLEHGETNIRERAASGLSRGNPMTAVPALVDALDDPHPGVRLFACQALMFQKDAGAVEAVAALLDDESADVRRVAVRTLGWLDAKDKLPAIRKLYERQDPADHATWVFADCFARLGDDELALRAARPLLSNSNSNVRFFVVDALALVKSKQLVPLLMNALTGEMEISLKHRDVPGRTFERICELLDRRADTEFGSDATARMRWWRETSAEYDVSAEDAAPPDGFDELALRFAEAIAKRHAPRDERAGSYCNLRVTYGPVERREEKEQASWSEPVNGLRARLFAKPRYRRGEVVQVLLILENTGREGLRLPGAVVDPIVPYVSLDGSEARILRPLAQVETMQDLFGAGAMRMITIDISADPRLEQRLEDERIDGPARRYTQFDMPPRPGKYHFRAIFSPCGIAPDCLGDGRHAEEFPDWKSKQLVTPPIEIEIVESEE